MTEQWKSKLKQLEVDLQPAIGRILEHRFIKRLQSGDISKEQLIEFALQYGIYCSYFPRFLCAAAANIADDQTRFSLVENLWEEHGSGDLKGSHRVLYKNFCLGLGLTEESINNYKPFPSTLIYVEYMLNMCQDANYLKSLGALGPGTEFFTSQEYSIIYEALKKFSYIPEHALEFWFVHISLDDHHYDDMLNSIVPWIKDEASFMLVKEGAERAIDLEFLFWEGIEDYLFGN